MITKVRILAAQPKDKSYYLWDTAIKGFGVRVYPSGIKSFVLTYRSPHLPASRAKRFAVLGRTDSMSVRQARLQAFQELAAVPAIPTNTIDFLYCSLSAFFSSVSRFQTRLGRPARSGCMEAH